MNTKFEEQDSPWFYEHDGERKGGVAKQTINELIDDETLSYDSLVWKKGFSSWTKIQETEFLEHLQNISPPPLAGDQVNNSIAWILACAPILGTILEAIVAGIIMGANNGVYVSADDFWYITLILNIVLAVLDERKLKRAGIDTGKFSRWVWFVPVYLYRRATHLKQKHYYFFTWIACFVLILL